MKENLIEGGPGRDNTESKSREHYTSHLYYYLADYYTSSLYYSLASLLSVPRPSAPLIKITFNIMIRHCVLKQQF